MTGIPGRGGGAGAGAAAGLGASGTQVVITIDSSGTPIDDFLVELLRKAVRTRGGDVQTVLGQ
jgi:hypothetical protein